MCTMCENRTKKWVRITLNQRNRGQNQKEAMEHDSYYEYLQVIEVFEKTVMDDITNGKVFFQDPVYVRRLAMVSKFNLSLCKSIDLANGLI